MTYVPAPEIAAERMDETRRAFDGVAGDYDGPRGNNALVRKMRRRMWATVTGLFPSGARLADLGCGTGIDAEHFGRLGYRVVAMDASPEMVRRTRRRVRVAGLEEGVTVRQLGIQDLDSLGDARFDGMYSNLGALNCVPDLHVAAAECARHLRPGGMLVFSIIGRLCPWETIFYLLTGRPRRAVVRLRRGMVPVVMNGGIVWTRYHTPREFFRAFESRFDLTHYRALALFAPPPYLIRLYVKAGACCDALSRLDDRVGHRPLLRDAGDHFLMVLTKRD